MVDALCHGCKTPLLCSLNGASFIREAALRDLHLFWPNGRHEGMMKARPELYFDKGDKAIMKSWTNCALCGTASQTVGDRTLSALSTRRPIHRGAHRRPRHHTLRIDAEAVRIVSIGAYTIHSIIWAPKKCKAHEDGGKFRAGFSQTLFFVEFEFRRASCDPDHKDKPQNETNGSS